MWDCIASEWGITPGTCKNKALQVHCLQESQAFPMIHTHQVSWEIFEKRGEEI